MRAETSVDIDAPADRVWEILADVERWPEWTASVTSVELLDPAPLAVGKRVRIKQPRLPKAVWTVTSFEPRRSFDWRAPGPGITTDASHHIETRGPDRVHVSLVIDQHGPLGRIVAPLFGGLTRRYMQTEAEGLKRRSERG